MFFIQHRWYPLSIVAIVVSVGMWFVTASIITASVILDFDFYGVITNKFHYFSSILVDTLGLFPMLK